MTFMDHDMSACSTPGWYGTGYPALPHLDLHIPLMRYEVQDCFDELRGGRGKVNPMPDVCLWKSLMGSTLSLSVLHLVLSYLG